MARPTGHSDSIFAGWVRGSWLYRALTAPLPAAAGALEHAAFIRSARKVPYGWHATVAAGLVLVAGGVLTGNVAAALMGVVATIAAVWTRVGLLALPALFIWAPRLDLAAVGDETLFVRLDQAAAAGLLAFCVFHPGGKLRSPPGNSVFLLFLGVVALSAALGILRGTLVTPVSSVLYLGQWLTLYAVYVVTFSLLAPPPDGLEPPGKNGLPPCETAGDRIQESTLVYAWAVPLIALAAYGLAEATWPYYEAPGIRYRTFERILFPGQANHAAGLFALATVTGAAMLFKPRLRVLGASLVVLSTLALVPTGSRTGVLSWIAGAGGLVLVALPSARWWLPPAGLAALWAVPGAWWRGISAPGTSMHDRLVAWKSALSTVDTYPLLGLGAGARHRSFYDNHYIMTLSESGLVGLVLLVLLLISLARAFARRPGGSSGACWWSIGALAGLAALAVHALATATFIVTLVAGPFFWFSAVACARTEPRR